MTTRQQARIEAKDEMIEVTQADREAAADLQAIIDWGQGVGGIRNGGCDDLAIVQAFARYRLASLPPVEMIEDVEGLARQLETVAAEMDMLAQATWDQAVHVGIRVSRAIRHEKSPLVRKAAAAFRTLSADRERMRKGLEAGLEYVIEAVNDEPEGEIRDQMVRDMNRIEAALTPNIKDRDDG